MAPTTQRVMSPAHSNNSSLHDVHFLDFESSQLDVGPGSAQMGQIIQLRFKWSALCALLSWSDLLASHPYVGR